jgi:hypothetical protein
MEEASRHIQLVGDRQPHVYRISLSDSPLWRGMIRQLRLDPSDQEGVTIAISYIRGIAAG